MKNLICCWKTAANDLLCKLSRSTLLIVFISLGNSGWAQSALEPVQVERGGSWLSGLYMNQYSRRPLCAMETGLADGSVFRINYYGLRNVFLEVTWGQRIAQGSFETELTFASDKRPALTLPTFVEANFMVVEMNDDSVAGELLQIIARAQALTVMNRTTPLFKVPVNGSAKALEIFFTCVRALGRHQP